MNSTEVLTRVGSAVKWSSITELVAKLVSPATTMILARLLAPEAFGVVATVTMIISFADMFSDSGFQKYLVQREFDHLQHKRESINVAFWTNISISFVLWMVIIILREQIAYLVGSPGMGFVIAVACVQLPIMSFSSIQIALYRRDFDYKTLFLIRIIGICIPFAVTIPLAYLGWSFWALIVGNICGSLANASILTWKSHWKPQLFYSFRIFRQMFSFSAWSSAEAIAIWLTRWIDIFIIGSVLSVYYLGLYRTSLTMANSILSLVTAATTPLLFTALSRLQDNNVAFYELFFTMQKAVAYLIFPLGVGIYLFNDVVTHILLGSQWADASDIVGIWALTSAIMIIFSHYCSEVYRAKGYPRMSFMAEILHLIFVVPTCLISMKFGFWVLVYSRALIRFQAIIVNMLIMKYAIDFPVGRILRNVLKPALFTFLMCIVARFLMQISEDFKWSLFSIGICAIFYLALMWSFANDDIQTILESVKRKDPQRGKSTILTRRLR